MVERINKIARIQRQLIQKLGRQPNDAEIAEEMNCDLTEEKIAHIRKLSIAPISLEKPIGYEDDTHFIDFIEDKKMDSPAKQAEKEELKREIDKIFAENLSSREEKVLRMRFGLLPTTIRPILRLAKETQDPNYRQLMDEVKRLDIHYDTQIQKVEALNNKIFEAAFSKYKTPQILDQAGKEFEVTRERVRQIEAKTIRKFKNVSKTSESKILREFFNH